VFPRTDPTPLFELFRGIHATELLTAAVAHFNLFDRLAGAPLRIAELQKLLGLADRPFIVLTTALRAMGLIVRDREGRFGLTQIAREHLVPDSAFDVGGYIKLAAQNPSVLAMVERLRTNLPQGRKPDDSSPQGTAFIYREGMTSAMEEEESARHLTLSLAGRARNVAPYLAEHVPLSEARLLLDIAGGSGIYSYALLRRNPQLRAVILDRPEVLKVAGEIAREFDFASRVELIAGDMFTTPYPKGADAVLLSNVLHDWDVPECRSLIRLGASALQPGGRLIIHDVFLNDDLDGPLPIALYSAALFALTEGRAYSGAECRSWLCEAGLIPRPIVPTLIHCGALVALKADLRAEPE
jgi:SAM-dependent methyltransferase